MLGEDKLRLMILDYKDKLLKSRDVEKYYLLLISFNSIYFSMSGEVLFDVRRDCDDLLFQKIMNYEQYNNDIFNKNMELFLKNDLVHLLDVMEEGVDNCDIDFKGSKSLNYQEQLEIVSDFFKNSNSFDYDVFNDIYSNNRLITYNSKEARLGVMMYDFVKDNPYVFISNPDNSFLTCSNIAHEVGHAINMKRLNTKNKESYYFNSPLVEVISQYYENKFYNYLIDKDIYKDEGKRLKLDFLKKTYYLLVDALSTDNLCHMQQDFKYVLGAVMAMQLENSDDKAVLEFCGKQNEIYVPSIVDDLENDVKSLKKEFKKLYK